VNSTGSMQAVFLDGSPASNSKACSQVSRLLLPADQLYPLHLRAVPMADNAEDRSKFRPKNKHIILLSAEVRSVN
jgi:hypothetical protein